MRGGSLVLSRLLDDAPGSSSCSSYLHPAVRVVILKFRPGLRLSTPSPRRHQWLSLALGFLGGQSLCFSQAPSPARRPLQTPSPTPFRCSVSSEIFLEGFPVKPLLASQSITLLSLFLQLYVNLFTFLSFPSAPPGWRLWFISLSFPSQVLTFRESSMNTG